MNTLTVVILLSPCFLVTVLLLFLTAVRYINYRERAALAQYGVLQNEGAFWERLGQRSPQGVLWAGVITAMSGLALLLGLYTIGLGPWLLGGLVPLFVGLGMVFIYFTGGAARQRKAEKEPEAPPPEHTETEGQAE